MRRAELLALLCAAAGATGCANKRIVSAAPASVSTPPPMEATSSSAPTVPPPAQPAAEPPPEPPAPTPAPEPAKLQAAPRPRPPQPEMAEPAPPKAAPPQISPQLSARDLETAKKITTANTTTAEKNLHLADGKQLNAAQKDLAGKISGFLSQAHEAILADDWVRAQNLAEKARVLSDELVKSF